MNAFVRLFHRHVFVPQRVKHFEVGAGTTIVLCRCRCGETRSEIHAGIWTLEELTGKDPIDGLIADVLGRKEGKR